MRFFPIFILLCLALPSFAQDRLRPKDWATLKRFYRIKLAVPTYLPSGYQVDEVVFNEKNEYRIYYRKGDTTLEVSSEVIGTLGDLRNDSTKQETIHHPTFGKGIVEFRARRASEQAIRPENSVVRLKVPSGWVVVVEAAGPMERQEFLKVVDSIREIDKR